MQVAVDGMAKGKTPGVDGLLAEFYQRFWPILKEDFVKVLNYCYPYGCLSLSQRSGLITLLYKQSDRLEMKNWRPITLLSTDYKIAAKAIANRLLQVLPSVIHSDQTCGIRGRTSIVNSRLLQDIVTDINQCGLGGAVLSLDQEKAFDRVDWAFLLRVLQTMNFGPSFCHWILLFYMKISSPVLVNGEQSESLFDRGVLCRLCYMSLWPKLLRVPSAQILSLTAFPFLVVGALSCASTQALVVNSLGLSTFWYLALFRTMPVSVMTAINACVYSSLWQNKREKIALSSITQRVGQGGLNIVDVGRKVSSLHVMWVRRLLDDPDHPSMYLFRHYLHVAFAGQSLEHIFLLPAPSQTAMNSLPPFFCSVMSSWFRSSRCLDAGGIIIKGPGSSSCPVGSLLSNIAVWRCIVAGGCMLIGSPLITIEGRL